MIVLVFILSRYWFKSIIFVKKMVCDYENLRTWPLKMRMTVRLRKIFSENIPNIDILLTFSQFFRKCDEKTHISGGWRPTWWLSIRFKRNTERAQNFTNYFWEPLTWSGDAEVACIYDVHKCSRASFSREHQTGILFQLFSLNLKILITIFGTKLDPKG